MNIHFILFDSCVVCYYDVEAIFSTLSDALGDQGTLVIINNDLSISENVSKLRYYKFRPYYRQIRRNLRFMSKNNKRKRVNTTFIHRGLVHDLLTDAESRYLKETKDKWYTAHSRQEVNDDAQLMLMNYIAELHDCNSVIVTLDRDLCRKVDLHPRLIYYKP